MPDCPDGCTVGGCPVGGSCVKGSYALGSKLPPRGCTCMAGERRFGAAVGVAVGLASSRAAAAVRGVALAVFECAEDGAGLLSTTRGGRRAAGLSCRDCSPGGALPLLCWAPLLAPALACPALIFSHSATRAGVGLSLVLGSQVGSYGSPVAGSIPFHSIKYCTFRFLTLSFRMRSASQNSAESESSSLDSSYFDPLFGFGRAGVRLRFGDAITPPRSYQ